MAEYLKIGKLVAAYGLKGELVLKHTLGKKSSLKGLQTVFIEDKKDSFLPWFIVSTKIKSREEIYLKLDGIDVRENAIKLVQKELWVPEADFKRIASVSSPVNLLGFNLVDDGKNLGEILEVIEQNHQLLCRLEINKKEVLIPLHEETLLKIDKKKKEVIVKLPDGLLEIYLKNHDLQPACRQTGIKMINRK